MMREFKFALYAIKKNIQSSAELRTSFAMNIIGMSINNVVFVVIWGFFVKSVGIINGWTVADVVGLQGFVALSFGIVFSVGGGIRNLADYVASGTFDRFMLAPKNLLVRIATSSFGASAVGDMVFGITCLVIYVLLIHASLYQILFIFLLVSISVVVFLAAMIAISSAGFYFTDSNAVTTSLFELFLTPSIFHGGAFHGITRFIFTFIIPSLLVGTLPIETVRNQSLGNLLLVSILALLWLAVSIKIFSSAVKKYESSNFMTFGN